MLSAGSRLRSDLAPIVAAKDLMKQQLRSLDLLERLAVKTSRGEVFAVCCRALVDIITRKSNKGTNEDSDFKSKASRILRTTSNKCSKRNVDLVSASKIFCHL